ncbi:hypothetical protein D3C71_1446290 [compost metagenome]
MRSAAVRRQPQPRACIHLEPLQTRLPQPRLAFGEGRRHDPVQHEGGHPALAQGPCGLLSQAAGWPADIGLRHACRHRRCTGIAGLARQAVDHVEHQRQGGHRTVLPGQRRAIRAPHPHTYRVMARRADRPGIAVAVAGAGLPGHTRAAGHIERAGAIARARIGFKHLAGDPGRAR